MCQVSLWLRWCFEWAMQQEVDFVRLIGVAATRIQERGDEWCARVGISMSCRRFGGMMDFAWKGWWDS